MEREIYNFTFNIRQIAGINYFPRIFIRGNINNTLEAIKIGELSICYALNQPKQNGRTFSENFFSDANIKISPSAFFLPHTNTIFHLSNRAIFRFTEKVIECKRIDIFDQLIHNFIIFDSEPILRTIHRAQKSLFEAAVEKLLVTDICISAGLLKWFAEFSPAAKIRHAEHVENCKKFAYQYKPSNQILRLSHQY